VAISGYLNLFPIELNGVTSISMASYRGAWDGEDEVLGVQDHMRGRCSRDKEELKWCSRW
jgi:hypothetical protein